MVEDASYMYSTYSTRYMYAVKYILSVAQFINQLQYPIISWCLKW